MKICVTLVFSSSKAGYLTQKRYRIKCMTNNETASMLLEKIMTLTIETMKNRQLRSALQKNWCRSKGMWVMKCSLTWISSMTNYLQKRKTPKNTVIKIKKKTSNGKNFNCFIFMNLHTDHHIDKNYNFHSWMSAILWRNLFDLLVASVPFQSELEKKLRAGPPPNLSIFGHRREAF